MQDARANHSQDTVLCPSHSRRMGICVPVYCAFFLNFFLRLATRDRPASPRGCLCLTVSQVARRSRLWCIKKTNVPVRLALPLHITIGSDEKSVFFLSFLLDSYRSSFFFCRYAHSYARSRSRLEQRAFKCLIGVSIDRSCKLQGPG